MIRKHFLGRVRPTYKEAMVGPMEFFYYFHPGMCPDVSLSVGCITIRSCCRQKTKLQAHVPLPSARKYVVFDMLKHSIKIHLCCWRSCSEIGRSAMELHRNHRWCYLSVWFIGIVNESGAKKTEFREAPRWSLLLPRTKKTIRLV